MCGINGFNFTDEELARKMNIAIRHRGPDDEGVFVADDISLGNVRLSIIDLSPAGHMPMTTPDGRFTITYNGEIYNFPELRQELEAAGIVFRSHSDTEVVLHLFAREGVECLKKLNGIFAFAIWDNQRKELTVARDRIGVKPLYYWTDSHRFIFSSEIKGLLVHDISRELDRTSLNLYFRFLYVKGPRTMFQGIKKLQPGHYLVVRDGEQSVASCWTPPRPASLFLDREKVMHDVRTLFLDAVRRQLVSDRPVGVFLSGGMDSTAVLAAMRQFAHGRIKTFSVGFETTPEQEKYNADFHLAAETARVFETDHHPLILNGRQMAECFEEVVYHMDEPVSNHIQGATMLLAKLSKPEVAVVLGGDGGDELFGGYDRYYYAQLLDRIDWLPQFLKIGRIKKAQTKKGVERFLSFMAQKEAVVAEFLRPDYNDANASSDAYAPLFKAPIDDFPNDMMRADVQSWLVDESLVRTDKMTMAAGLEERVPILDHRLVELALQIPSKWKLGTRAQGKVIFKEAIKDLLPPHILAERKRGFFSPASKWLRGDMQKFAREVLSESYTSATSNILNFSSINNIFEDHLSKRRYGLNTIWALMTFQVWCRRMLTKS